MKFWLYTALRFLLFGIGFFVTLFFTNSLIFALIVGLVIGFSITYLFTPKLRNEASEDFARVFKFRKRNKIAQDDAEAEDAYTAGRCTDATELQDDTDGEQEGIEDTKEAGHFEYRDKFVAVFCFNHQY